MPERSCLLGESTTLGRTHACKQAPLCLHALALLQAHQAEFPHLLFREPPAHHTADAAKQSCNAVKGEVSVQQQACLQHAQQTQSYMHAYVADKCQP